MHAHEMDGGIDIYASVCVSVCVCECVCVALCTCNTLPFSIRVRHGEQAERVTCYIGHVTRSHPCVKIMEAPSLAL